MSFAAICVWFRIYVGLYKIKREQLRAAPVYEFPIGTISKVKKIVLGSWCKGIARFDPRQINLYVFQHNFISKNLQLLQNRLDLNWKSDAYVYVKYALANLNYVNGVNFFDFSVLENAGREDRTVPYRIAEAADPVTQNDHFGALGYRLSQ